MFVTVVAVMCHMIASNPPTIAPSGDCTNEEQKVEEIVTDSRMDESVEFFGCMIHAQMGIAEWKSKHPLYFKEGWRVAQIKCAPGTYVPKVNS
jgi:hypothetical protein